MQAMCSIAVGQSFKNVPNDNKECPKVPAGKERPQVPTSNNGNADVLATTAKTRQSEQGALKRGGIDLLVMPPKLKADCRPGGLAASTGYAVW